MPSLTVSISRSKFVDLARFGYPAEVIVQLGLPDLPVVIPPSFFRVADPIDMGKTVSLKAWLLCPRYSQDTRIVIDRRIEEMVKDFRDGIGVINTITAAGISVRTPIPRHC